MHACVRACERVDVLLCVVVYDVCACVHASERAVACDGVFYVACAGVY